MKSKCIKCRSNEAEKFKWCNECYEALGIGKIRGNKCKYCREKKKWEECTAYKNAICKFCNALKRCRTCVASGNYECFECWHKFWWVKCNCKYLEKYNKEQDEDYETIQQ